MWVDMDQDDLQTKNDDLPQGWQSALDPNSGKPYYFHESLRQPQWDRPVVAVPAVGTGAPSLPEGGASGGGATQS